MLDYTSQRQYKINTSSKGIYSQALTNLVSSATKALNIYGSRQDELHRVSTSNILHKYQMNKEAIISDDSLEGNAKLEALTKVGEEHKELLKGLQKKYGESEYFANGFKNLELDFLKTYDKVKAYEKKKLQIKATKDFKDKLQNGVFPTVAEAKSYSDTLKLGIGKDVIKKEFELQGTQRALKYIQSSTVDGVPTELLRFKTRDDVIKAFYSGIDKDKVNVPNGVISAISSAHKWKIAQNKKGKGDNRINELLYRLKRSVGNDINNTGLTPNSTINSLMMLHPLAKQGQKHQIEDTLAKIEDNNNLLSAVRSLWQTGKSRSEIETSLQSYRTVSNTPKGAIINRGINKVLTTLESEIDSTYNTSIDPQLKRDKLSQLYTNLFNFDPATAEKKANTDIKKELSTLTSSTVDNLILKLDTYINAKTTQDQPTPLAEQRFLNELQSVQAITARGGFDKEELSSLLNKKKREYIEGKRTKNKKYLNERTQLIADGLKDSWTEFDNTATKRDISKFLLQNPDIPDDHLLEAFNQQTTDIDTTATLLRLGGWGGEYDIRLGETLQNGKLLIPDDRELRESSISTELKSYIPTHSDKFMEFVVGKAKTTIKELETSYNGKFTEIDNLNIEFDKNKNGEILCYIYGSPKALGTNELLGIIDNTELTEFLNETKGD